MTCEERAEVLAETLAGVESTDWGEPPHLVMDEARFERYQDRVLDTGQRLLLRAIDEVDDLFLFMEDDVEFNHSIRHNLAHWAPIVARRPGSHFFASLYNPNIAPAATPSDPSSAVVGDPRGFYGTQGVVMSLATARSILDDWHDAPGMPDIRMSRLAARHSPIWFHRPSLVQHRPVESLWGGATHFAIDFSPDWRAPEVVLPPRVLARPRFV
jgi:hypothetical protein